MTSTNCNTHTLVWLILCSIKDLEVLILVRPSLSLHVPLLEDCFINKDKMSLLIHDIVDLVIKTQSCLLKLWLSLYITSRHSWDLHLLFSQASDLHHLKHNTRFDPPITELSMKHNASFGNAQASPKSLVCLRDNKIKLFRCDVFNGNLTNFCIIFCSLCKVLPMEPIQSFLWYLQNISHHAHW